MKRLLPVFITFCLLILCNLQHSNLYAQDPELFEHTWYFANGELNGEEFYPTVNLTADLYFYPNDILIGYTYCEGGISFENILYEEGNFLKF